MNKKVSIITPVKNLIRDDKKDKLIACLKSVQSQTLSDIEHILVEGGSDDETGLFLDKLKKDFSFEVLSKPDKCIPDALTNGVNQATGDWIMFLNVDDSLLFPEAVEKTVELAKAQNADFIYGGIKWINENGKTGNLPENVAVFPRELPFYLQSICVKAPLAKKLMPFNNTLEETDSWVFAFISKLLFSKALGVKNTDIISQVFMRFHALDKLKKRKDEILSVVKKYFICPPDLLENMIYKGQVNLEFYSFVLDKINPIMKEEFNEKFQQGIKRLECLPKYVEKGYKKLYMPLQGIGDALLFSPVARAISLATGHKVLVGTGHKDLFENNPYVEATDIIYDVPAAITRGLVELMEHCGLEIIHPMYWVIYKDSDGGYGITYPDKHIIEQTAIRAGFTGSVDLKPEMYLTDEEKEFGRFARPWRKQIAIMSTAKEPQKQWKHFQELVEILKYDYDIVQIGAKDDKILDGVTFQQAGKLTLRQTASVLYNSDVFVGEIGGLMHMARAVDCPAVIAYSSAEPAYFASYTANKNVKSDFDCTLPRKNSLLQVCNHCPNARRCVGDITVDKMLEAIREVLSFDKKDMPFETVQVKGDLLPNSIEEHFLHYDAVAAARK